MAGRVRSNSGHLHVWNFVWSSRGTATDYYRCYRACVGFWADYLCGNICLLSFFFLSSICVTKIKKKNGLGRLFEPSFPSIQVQPPMEKGKGMQKTSASYDWVHNWMVNLVRSLLFLFYTFLQFCEEYGVEFLPWRCWIGFWVMMILFGVVALEGCFLVRYFTRFTEEIFACLISAIFIYEAIHFLEVVRYLHESSLIHWFTGKKHTCVMS